MFSKNVVFSSRLQISCNLKLAEMNANFLKNYMDLDEFLAVKDLCTGLSRTESDYSEDEVDQDLVNFLDEDDISTGCSLPAPEYNMNSTPVVSPCSNSDTDEGRGESICSFENPASLSSSESLTSLNENVVTPKKRKRKTANYTEKAAPRKKRRKANSDGAKKGMAEEGADFENDRCIKTGAILPRTARQSVDETAKDDKYWERRRKNNQAAKRSRDLKRQKEMNVKEKAASLEEENRQLRDEVKKLKDYLRTLDEKVDK